ncbi:hypothetical protein G6011_05212 [Alternaria panax]|uniref:Uncharacterized protein n=1 Tax=Alternaria panax TaxID=48097 RepID=A0AAD4FD09_9PLEO|nr:hypothetical protein G6011_05212 [Alternaria panax]
MAFTPRKRATPTTTFDTTWNETDAAFLTPSALPVSKIPRAWERKQEVKRVGEGKEKKIWRRFNLRSRAEDTPHESEDEEEQDARSRPVKRQQHMSPKAMEKSTSRLGKKRAFKATRWDRRKSVLPRKRTTYTEDPVTGANDEAHSEEGEDSNHNMEGESIDETNAVTDEHMEAVPEPPSVEDDISTFTFLVDTPTADVLPNRESVQGDQRGLDSTEDATIANLFRSPLKQMSNIATASPSKVEYPELPLSDNLEAETDAIMTEVARTEKSSRVVKKTGTVETNSVSEGLQEEIDTRIEEVISNQGNDTELEEAALMSEASEPAMDLQYPALPLDETMSPTLPPELDQASSEDEDEDAKLSAAELGTSIEKVRDDVPSFPEASVYEEDFTEASLQLNIQREYQAAVQEHGVAPAVAQEGIDGNMDHGSSLEDMIPSEADMADAPVTSIDIADGLTFSFTPTKSHSPTQRRLHSPPPPPRPESGPDDATMTIAFDDDTAVLKEFLNRAAASKAEKAAVTTHKRESLQNRRDSDVIRHALASPRKVLEEKDPNSPSKQHTELMLDLSQIPTLSKPTETLPSPTPDAEETETAEEKSAQAARRSLRKKISRLPAPGPPKINIRRADGNEVVVLKKDDAKVLADTTRNNTRKNKQGAFCVTVRLMKLAMDSYNLPPIDDAEKELIVGKNVRWDETLAYYQESPDTVANALAEAESLSTPDELGMSDAPEPKKKKEKTSKTSTPKIRRVRGLGTTNGTPGKGLLAPSSLLPEAVQEEKGASDKQVPKAKSTTVKKMPVASSTSTSIDRGLSSSTFNTKLPSLDVAPVGVQPGSQRKSRLAAPKKVVLPQTPSAKAGDKENVSRLGISDITPKKGLPAPKVVIPATASGTTPVGMESGLPRRRGRKY